MKVVVDGIVLADRGSVNGNMNADFPTCSGRLDVKTCFSQDQFPNIRKQQDHSALSALPRHVLGAVALLRCPCAMQSGAAPHGSFSKQGSCGIYREYKRYLGGADYGSYRHHFWETPTAGTGS